MNNFQYTLVGNDEGSNIVVFVPGSSPQVAHESHPNFAAIVDGALQGDVSVVELFDIAQTAAQKFQRLSERITTANGRLYLDGEEVDNALSTQVLRFIEEGVDDWQPLIAFFENVQANPNEHSREQMFEWLNRRDFTITQDGLIVGYKGVKADLAMDDEGDYAIPVYCSIKSGKATVNGEVVEGLIPTNPGDLVEMPRSEVEWDPSVGCHRGLHVGSWDYAFNFAKGAVMEVHVNPRDVVSVPTDFDAAKVRCCRYTIINVVEVAYTAAVIDYAADADGDGWEWGDGDDYSDYEY